jgi:hypothetical protein
MAQTVIASVALPATSIGMRGGGRGGGGRSSALVVERVAGTKELGDADGALKECQFAYPIALCRYGDSLFVAEQLNRSIRAVEGVLGVANPLANSKVTGTEFEARAVPLIMTAIPVLPKELARLMAQYAQNIGRIRAIAGVPGERGSGAGGPALSGAPLFDSPSGIAVDTTDPMAGPQLIIGDRYRVRCLHLRTEMVTTIAGGSDWGYADGPASRALFGSPCDIPVAPPNGALFVVDRTNRCIRRISRISRISPVKAHASGAAIPTPTPTPTQAERMVTTLIGEATGNPDVQFAHSAAEPFRAELPFPWALALHVPSARPLSATVAVAVDADDRDVGVLYVSSGSELHAFDLTEGVRKRFELSDPRTINGIAVTEDGARLFVVTVNAVHVVDTRTGACAPLTISVATGGPLRVGPTCH